MTSYYALGWFAVKLLPSRDVIDEKSLEAGARVSGIRICLSLIIDTFIVSIPYSISKTTLPFPVFIAVYFAIIPLYNGKTLGSALLRFGIVFEKNKWVGTIFRGLLLTVYFYLIPSGLQNMMYEFNKYADSLLYIALFLITFLILILFWIFTIGIVLLNKRFLFDRLSRAGYRSTVRNQ